MEKKMAREKGVRTVAGESTLVLLQQKTSKSDWKGAVLLVKKGMNLKFVMKGNRKRGGLSIPLHRHLEGTRVSKGRGRDG